MGVNPPPAGGVPEGRGATAAAAKIFFSRRNEMQ